jgi:hypothetical protein
MAEVFEFFVAIEGHWVIAQVANVGLSHLYIDDEWRDTHNPDPFNLWGPHNLFEPGLFALEWRTILCGSIIRADGQQALIEVQIRSGLSRVFGRILVAGKVVKRVSCPQRVKDYAKPLPAAPMALEKSIHPLL